MSLRIAITDVTGHDLVYRADGARLRAAIEAAWPSGEVIEIDFGNLRIASASFLDEGIAHIGLVRPIEEIKRRLRIVNITAPDRRLLNDLLISRARQRDAAISASSSASSQGR